ncbi:nucleotide-diphospho-sugar transferases [Lucifera butyrica]|uniref:Nucleotide-diphospho-sugar transferases n=1 Tax=Lucifera butyrica TaxID=1351585 RepID=A0A498R2U1_9FIRM|nr:TPR domain-containing glycosyltransferase [Lucifera butyrica]VBB05475.1 nucleotide-diphospho-sugar transferases [Lucifera butyrica]
MLSLCMIVKNEEKNLARCLSSVSGAVDEIIIVDTGSADNTLEIARSFGAKITSFLWNNNFSDARNASLSLAGGDWILFLDADEELAPGSINFLKQAMEAEDVEGYFLKIVNFLGNEGWQDTCPDLVFRLFRNRPDYRFHGAIHEQIVDVILEKNKQARYQRAENVIILHYGYLDSQIEDKDKKARNLQLIEQEVGQDPENRLLRYHYGVELFRDGRYEEAAAELIRAANGIDPQTIYLPKLLRYIVLAYHAAKKTEEALNILKTAIPVFPDYADLYYYQGLLHYERKEYDRSFQAFNLAVTMPEQAVHYAPFAGTRGFRAYCMLGQLAELFCNPEEALHFYIAALRDNPRFTTALEKIIAILDPVKEPAYTKTALFQLCDVSTPSANLFMAQILFSQAAYGLALEFLDQGTVHQPLAPETSLSKAICLIQNRRFFEALRIIETFEPGHPLFPLAKLNQLFCFWLQGNRRQVRLLANDLLSLGLSADTAAVVGLLRDSLTKKNPKPVTLGEDGTALLADILKRTLSLDEAAKAESLLGSLNPEIMETFSGTAGKLYLRFGFPALAEHYLRQYSARFSEDAETLEHLATALTEQDRPEETILCYQQCIRLEPKMPRYYIKLIRLYEQLRNNLLQTLTHKYPQLEMFRVAQSRDDTAWWSP